MNTLLKRRFSTYYNSSQPGVGQFLPACRIYTSFVDLNFYSTYIKADSEVSKCEQVKWYMCIFVTVLLCIMSCIVFCIAVLVAIPPDTHMRSTIQGVLQIDMQIDIRIKLSNKM